MNKNFRSEDKKTLKRKLTKKIITNADRLRHKKVTMPQAKAFSVHLLTASGSFLAFLSLISASQKEWTAMFCWLGFALLIDGIDGPIARKLDVKYVLPTWSGELLDNIIDYVTYVLIPAFALYQSGLMGPRLSFLLSAIIVISSAIYYADTGMKTKENFFKGFPVVWNMMVFMLFVVRPGEWITFTIISLSAVISFLPIYFIHPVRVIRLRKLNFSIFLLWCFFSIAAFFYQLDSPSWVKIGISVTGIYMYCIGAVMQLFPQLGVINIKKR
ncbi:phosphatidylcholine synthase [Bartonella phoceensis]|uniref:phosphatidylcholine synthase n=1 Tax=Bartonella phoceensis TaxID=270249 RepID=UPI001ABB6DA3|nr:phosphatidylcholine/phosphatidylserine synthase [Bartonella phoceensis]